MKVNIEMDNIGELVSSAIQENLETIIRKEVDKVIREEVANKSKDIITDTASMKLREYVEQYIKTAEITVGGGLYSNDKATTYTVEEYIRKELAEKMQQGMLTVPNRDRYGNKTTSVSFEDFIKQEFNPEALIKTHLSKFIEATKNDINTKINDTFTNSTKNMLSETVYNVLIKNETFAKLNDNIKCIADKKE